MEGGREGVVIRRSGVEKCEGKEKGREGEPCVVLCRYVVYDNVTRLYSTEYLR